ncbi:hypothetical protein FACS1894208_11510 [Clostridia bacterium]|nr:hypothetical protein FACS1894208_11510 [Clostridia bacterium]
MESFVRPNKIFTADKHLILSVAGHLTKSKFDETVGVLLKALLVDLKA